jgi:hypothetical protein
MGVVPSFGGLVSFGAVPSFGGMLPSFGGIVASVPPSGFVLVLPPQLAATMATSPDTNTTEERRA